MGNFAVDAGESAVEFAVPEIVVRRRHELIIDRFFGFQRVPVLAVSIDENYIVAGGPGEVPAPVAADIGVASAINENVPAEGGHG